MTNLAKASNAAYQHLKLHCKRIHERYGYLPIKDAIKAYHGLGGGYTLSNNPPALKHEPWLLNYNGTTVEIKIKEAGSCIYSFGVLRKELDALRSYEGKQMTLF